MMQLEQYFPIEMKPTQPVDFKSQVNEWINKIHKEYKKFIKEYNYMSREIIMNGVI